MNDKNNFPLGAGYVSLSIREKIGYGMGDFASNISFALITLFSMSFYTDVYNFSVEQAGLILFVARILDAAFNLVIGRFIDRTKTRYGKLRPYLLYGSFPLGVMTVLCFTVFQGAYRFYVALAIYTLFCFCYTLVNTPYSALTTRMTQEPGSRASLAIYRFVLAFAAYSIMAVAVGPALDMFASKQSGYLWIAVAGAVVATVCFLVCFRECRERVADVEPSAEVHVNIVRLIFGNRPLLVLSWCAAFIYLATTVWMTLAVYYVRYNIGGDQYLSEFFLMQSIGYLLGTVISGRLISQFGKKSTSVFMLCAGSLSLFVQYAFPQDHLLTAMVSVLLFSLTTSSVMVAIWAMIADTVEHGEWVHGQRSEGLIYSFFNFVTKVAMALAGGIAGLLLSQSGYDAAAVTPSAMAGIKFSITVVPAIMMLACAVGIGFYSINESGFQRLVAAIAARKLKASSVSGQ